MGWAAEQPHGVGNGVVCCKIVVVGSGGISFIFLFWQVQPSPACQPAASHGALNSISWCCACHARSRIVGFFFPLSFICVRACVPFTQQAWQNNQIVEGKRIITSEGRLTPCVWYLHAGKAVPSRAQRVPSCMIPTAAAAAVVRGCRDMQC